MDTRTVAGLAGKALDGVLGFRVNAFKPKAFIDIKTIRTATAGAIRAISKQRAYNGEIALVNIVEVVGNAISTAAGKWNKVADPKNHIDSNWLRHCVCDLVGGAVTHAVLEENKWLNAEVLEREYEDEEEYLDPAGDEHADISLDTIDTVIHRPAAAAAPNDDDGYYGLQQAHPVDENSILEHEAPLLPRHQIDQGWTALSNGLADPYDWPAVHEHIDAATAPERDLDAPNPFRKRSAPSTDSENDDDDDQSEAQIIQPKRRRNKTRVPAAPMTKALEEEDDDEEQDQEEGEEEEDLIAEEPLQQRKVSTKIAWSLDESNRLVSIRDSGKSWDEVHLAFSNRTRAAIMHKYRTLKESHRTASRNVPEDGEDGGASVLKPKMRIGRDAGNRGSRM